MIRDVVRHPRRQKTFDKYGYAPAIASGDFLFVSGQVGVDDDGKPVTDPAAQAEAAFANLAEVLDAAGCSFDHVLEMTSYHVDMHTHFKAFAAAKSKAFPEAPYPAWTAIGVSALANPALLFEIKATARRSS